jgi:glycosyltransferase involved in cell wall biosynthesis
MLDSPRGTGVSRYARTLIEAQARLTHDTLELRDDSVFGARPAALERVGRWARAIVPWARAAHLRIEGGRQLLHAADLFRLAQVYFDIHGRLLPIRAPGTGVMHWTYPVPLRLVGWHNVYTVHDVIPLLEPALSPIAPARLRRLLRAVAGAGDALVTVSAAARDDIMRELGCKPERVFDCGQAIDPTQPASVALPDGAAPRGYFLVCGAIEPRKNLVRLLEAYRRSVTGLPLLFVGPDGWRAAEIVQAIAATPGARRLGYLPDEGVRALLANARALLMPSLAEGFGLPAAEAMALGTPVMTSDRGALAEVAGGAALAIDPMDVAAMADAIARLATDDALCGHLAQAGRASSTRFAPDGFAARLERVYRAVIAADEPRAYPPSVEDGARA